MKKRIHFFILFFVLLTLLTAALSAQERLFWDFPSPINLADGGRFPELLELGDGLAVIWQEFQGGRENLDATISIRALISEDGTNWDNPPITIAENLSYLWVEEVPLFSAASSPDGRLVVAVAAGGEGVLIFSDDEDGGVFRRRSTLAPGIEAADVAVAPRLAASPDGRFILFLTRRTVVEGASRPTTLTIFTSQSVDGNNWTAPELFIDPQTDRAIDGAVLEQNFLPSYLYSAGNEYVVFQSLRQGSEGQVYQLYQKYKPRGGQWQSAKPISESIGTGEPVNDPLLWDNQRPDINKTAGGEILVSWERRQISDRPGIVAAVLGDDAAVLSERVEVVTVDRYTSAGPQILNIKGASWILWFDDTGIRLARRNRAYDYDVEAASLDSQTPGADRGSAVFPSFASRAGNTYILWQDRAGGLERAILIRPDLRVDTPGLRNTNFLTGRPGNNRTAIVEWFAPEDSSGILSYSWLWSRNPNQRPSREELYQVYGEARAVYRFDDSEDAQGDWYFSLIAQDQAGNWSDPLLLSYNLDSIPPPPPTVKSPPTDAYGFLRSNSFTVEWQDAEESPALYYRWRLDYLAASPEQLNFDTVEALRINDPRRAFSTSGTNESVERGASWTNLDNGVWAFTVTAIDMAGNQGLPSTELLLTRRYRPVTFITEVSSRKDDQERITLRITGRGFSAGGYLSSAIIDRDGEAPWDYEYFSSDSQSTGSQLRVLSDRTAEIVGIEDMDEGTYRIAVRHPVRGLVFWNRSMRLDSTGNVKFGPFGLYTYESLWTPAARSLRLSGNQLIFVLAALLALSAIVITTARLASIGREARILEENARAIMARELMSAAAREESVMLLKKKGMGLRIKFTLALTSLVILTILMVTVLLGVVWLNQERDTLAKGLENESRLMVETLASTARTSIPTADRGSLLLLPDRISALSDALWTTVTGPRAEVSNGILRATSDGYGYVWATNDTDILDKLALPENLSGDAYRIASQAAQDAELSLLESSYPENNAGVRQLVLPEKADSATLKALLRSVGIMSSQSGLGSNRIEDELSEDIEQMRLELEQEAQDAGIARMISELTVLEQQYAELAREVVLTLDFGNPAFVEAEQAVASQKKEIETLLLELSSTRFRSYPEFNAETLKIGGSDSFIFYKPLLYRVGQEDANFFRGTVRLAVSVDSIRQALADVQRRIVIITLGASAAALFLGLVVAFFISSLMLKPIKALIQGVSRIQQEPDMLKHESFDVSLNTGDELAGLADTINGMVRGLVRAAIDQKELMAGQDIQKTFLPLTVGKDGKKLSVGGVEDTYFRLFGYYEGADAVSGDYFGFRQLDDSHYAMIKLDIAGHGVTASLIMVQVASLFVDFFRKVREKAKETGRLEYSLREFTFGINDLLHEVGFQGRFAAFNLSVINIKTAEYRMIHAGDNLVHIYDGKRRKMKLITLPEAPATGQIPSDMIIMNDSMYQENRGKLERGDILFLYTDGVEESHHLLRDKNFLVKPFSEFSQEVQNADKKFVEAGYKPIDSDQENEEFDPIRIDEVIEASLNKGLYVLERRCDLTIAKSLHFDFSTLEGNSQDAILALAAVEKVFRLVPDPKAGPDDRVRVDRKIVEFLQEHFAEFAEFYNRPVEEDEDSPYIFYTHLKEDEQGDDLTIWAYERL